MFSTWNYTKYMFYFVSCKLSIILNCSREGFYSMHRIAKSMDNVSHLYAKLLSWLISQALHSPYQWRWPLKILKPNEVIELAEPLTGERWIILEKLWKYLISTVFPRVNETKKSIKIEVQMVAHFLRCISHSIPVEDILSLDSQWFRWFVPINYHAIDW